MISKPCFILIWERMNSVFNRWYEGTTLEPMPRTPWGLWTARGWTTASSARTGTQALKRAASTAGASPVARWAQHHIIALYFRNIVSYGGPRGTCDREIWNTFLCVCVSRNLSSVRANAKHLREYGKPSACPFRASVCFCTGMCF